jgi:pilus assembly protein CpaE
MAQIVSFFVTEDEEFKKHLGRLLRSGAIPISVLDQLREGVAPDVVIVDARGDASSAMGTIERLRAGLPGSAIFAVAQVADPDLILQAMRAGANEFFTWPPAEDTFHSAMRRTASRRETAAGAAPAATTLVFFGAKGGAGTTTIAVNCGVELARITKRSTVVVDLKPGLGEVALFLGVRPRYSIIDAITICTGWTASSRELVV